MDRSGVSLVQQRDHRVDHRQAGADQQTRAPAGPGRETPPAPRDRRAREAMPATPAHRRRRRPVIAGGQHHDVGRDRVARGKPQHPTLDRHDAVVQRVDPAMLQRRGSADAADRRHTAGAARSWLRSAARRPAIVATDAPASRGNAAADRQMRSCARPARSAGGWDCRLHRRARTERRFALDQRDARARRHVAQQVQGRATCRWRPHR